MQVPEGWIKETTGSLCISIVPGRNKPKSFTGEIPWVTTPDITARYIPTKEQELFVSKAEMQECGGKLVPVDSVIMAAVGDLGLVAINSEPVMLNQQLHAFVPKLKITTEFLAYWLSTQQQYMLARASKTTIPYLNKSNCESIPVLVPPLKEQQKIVQILSTWDKAITTTEQLLANSQQQKKALMQQLLTGKKRLLDDNGQRFSGEWEELRLKKLFDFKRGKGLSKSAISESGKYKCILYGELFTYYPEVVFNVISKTNSDDSVLSISGDILIPGSTTTSGIDLANATALIEDDVFLGGDINILRPRNEVCSPFFAYLLTHIEKHQIASLAQGITIIHIYGADLKTLKVKIPKDIKEQQKIATVLTAADNEITRLQQKLDQLKQEKKALMQQLLTGKRRVKVEEVA